MLARFHAGTAVLRCPERSSAVFAHSGSDYLVHQRRLFARTRGGVGPERRSMATRIRRPPHPRQLRFRDISSVYPSKPDKAWGSGVGLGVPLLLRVPRIQIRPLALSG